MSHIEIISDEESFNNSFYYFVEALNVLALEAAQQCESNGGAHVAWEIQHDVLDNGIALANWAGNYLSSGEKDAILELVSILKRLPDAALLSDGIQAMNHSSWIEPRKCAKRLISSLGDAISRNKEFFKRMS